MNDVLMQAKRLKESAKANRDFDELEEALNDLNKAISYLIPIDAQVEDGDYKTALRRELADCYGMMGGIYRRLANKGDLKRNLEESAEMYRKGLVYEIDDSYNLSNSVVIPILIDPLNLKKQQKEIREGIKLIQEQVRGKRKDQWWAWADLGLFNLLIGDDAEALKAYRHFTKVGARAQDYESTLSVLRELKDVLHETEATVAQSIENIIEFLEGASNSMKS